MKRKHLLKSTAALLLALGVAAAPAGSVLPIAPAVSLTAEASFSYTPDTLDFTWNDYSTNTRNIAPNLGMKAITDPAQFDGLKPGNYYLDCPDGICDLSKVTISAPCDGNIYLNLNGNMLLMGDQKTVPIKDGNTLTITDSGRKNTVHRFKAKDTDLTKMGAWVPDENGDIAVQGGCIVGLNADLPKTRLTMHGGNLINVQLNDLGSLYIYGGNLLNETYIKAKNESFVESAAIAYNSSIAFDSGVYYTVKSCRFFNNNCDCISSVYRGMVIYCTFDNCMTAMAVGNGALIGDCKITNCDRGIWCLENGSVDNVEVTDCRIGFDCYAGTLLLNKCRISGCQTSISQAVGSLDVFGCTINGGSIEADCTRFYMDDSHLDQLSGGISIGNSSSETILNSVSIVDCTITDCDGTGIRVNDNGTAAVSLNGTTVSGCKSHPVYAPSPKSLKIKDCEFSVNNGSILTASGNVTVTDSIFTNNTTTVLDLRLPDDSTAAVSGCRFEKNTNTSASDTECAVVTARHISSGGTAATDNAGKLFMKDCFFNGNEVEKPLYIRNMPAEIETSDFSHNVCKGDSPALAVEAVSSDVTVKGIMVNHNICESDHPCKGAIRVFNGHLTLDGSKYNCTVMENSAVCPDDGSLSCGSGVVLVNSDVKFMGSVNIHSNTIESGGKVTERNLSLDGGSCIEVDTEAPLTEASMIGVSAAGQETLDCGKNYKKISGAVETPTIADHFFSDEGYLIECNMEPGEEHFMLLRADHQWGEWQEKDGELIRTCKVNSAHAEHREIEKYSVSVWSFPMRTGSVTASSYEAKPGDKVTLTVKPYQNYVFEKWNVVKGDITIDENGTFIMPSGDVEIAAHFAYSEPESHTISVWATPSRTGHVQASADEAEAGEIVTLTAKPYADYKFVKWTVVAGNVTIDENNSFVMPDEKVEITAEFEYAPPTKHTISAWADPSRTGKVNLSAEEAAAGEIVTLSPAPYSGYEFVKWTVVAGDVTIDETNSFVMPDENVEIVAEFSAIPPTKHSVSAWAEPHRTGKVILSTDSAAAGEIVTLTPAPYDDYKFSKWNVVSGNVTIDENNSFVMPDEDVSIVAEFEYAPKTKHSVSVWVFPMRTGSVTASTYEAEPGEKVTLTVKPIEGYRFEKWNVVKGDITIGEDGTFIMPDGDVEIAAHIEYIQQTKYSVSVWADPTRTGHIDVSSDTAAAGEKITLTPRAYEGYEFKGWNVIKGDITIDETNSFIMPEGDVQITARFESTAKPASLPGDANCDGKVTIADAAAVLQYLGNKDRYPLTEQGAKNADCDGTSGITTADAIAIQKYAAGIITKLG